MIDFEGVHKAFGDKKVLRGIDLEVAAGESLVIIGGSGTGKSVALKCILGLLPVDGNAFQATAQAGAYYMWDAGIGPAGDIVSASLEASTVDITEEFSNMIIAQRAYSSNARIIQTADEMLQEITNLKR